MARLREENQRLSEALKTAEWMNHAKDIMIDEAEKMFNIPIRKRQNLCYMLHVTFCMSYPEKR